MDALEAIMTRRSVRKYTDQPVTEEVTTQLLKAAMAAPSAGNQQPWHFVVVRGRAMLEQVAGFSQYAGMARDAQLVIIVCADLDIETHKGMWPQDCSAAVENILLAAHALGLGAVWLGTYPHEERVARLREMFGIPENVVPMAGISIGYPAVRTEPADRFDPARIHLERW